MSSSNINIPADPLVNCPALLSDSELAAMAGQGSLAAPSSAATAGDPNAVYALGSSAGESARLQRQAEELEPDSTVLLDRIGLRPGDSAIDLGCGPRGVIDLLAERTAPGGWVVGLDADPAHVAMASEFVARRSLSGVEIIRGDARHTDLASSSFDLVHARTLLVTVPEPAEVLREMVRLTRPGGWVAGLEPDTEPAICYPPHPAYDRLCEIFTAAFRRNGANPHFGRRMAELYKEAGLEEVTVEARAGVYPHGHSRRTIRADLVRSIHAEIIEMGLSDQQELNKLDTAARKHLENPDVLVMPAVNFLAWGRKPRASS